MLRDIPESRSAATLRDAPNPKLFQIAQRSCAPTPPLKTKSDVPIS